jgi:hypothetical protein
MICSNDSSGLSGGVGVWISSTPMSLNSLPPLNGMFGTDGGFLEMLNDPLIIFYS